MGLGLGLFADRSLHPDHVTTASRVMLPAYLLHNCWFAVIYMFDPQGRLERTPGLASARYIGLPFEVWGVLVGMIAAMIAVSLVGHFRVLMVFALYCNMVVLVWWAVIYGSSALISPDSSLAGGMWPTLAAFACHASAKSLMRTETQA